MSEVYTDVKKVTVPGFRMARYVMITPQPEDDVNGYMYRWIEKSGLPEGYTPRVIGWDFPFVDKELTKRFGLRGYVSACILPDGFEPKCGGVEIASVATGDYLTICVTEPFSDAFALIPEGYHRIFEYIKQNGIKQPEPADSLCFEEVRREGGHTYMDIYIPIVSADAG